ncbi:MAG: oligosaccharide flippase family protein [Actinomycetota bacterium]|nr:oligosaccharide flippase family protein [Actinomycetota bacterium]MDK1096220.1 oligosaccharide flippase family protein [Actinomycetota bacterium]
MIGRIFRHSTVYVVAVVFQRGLPLVLLPIVASQLSGSSIGAIGLGVLVAGAVSLIATLGLNVATIRYRADESGVSLRSWSSLFVVQLGWSLLVGLVFLGIATAWLPWDASEGGRALAHSAIALGLAQSWLQMATASYRARQKPGGYLAITAAVFAISIPTAVILTQSLGTVGYLRGLAIGAAVPAIIGVALSISRPTFDRKFLFGALLLSAPFMVHWAATWGLMGFDRILIDRYVGLEAVGVFYLAFLYASIPLLVAESFGTAWLPAFLNADVDDRTLGRLTAVVSLGIAGLVVLGIGAAIMIMPLLYADLDAAVLPLLAILAPMAIIRVPHIVATAPIVAAHRTTTLGFSSVGAAAVNVTAVVAVVGSFGLAGVAWSKILAFAVASLWLWLAAMPRATWPVGLVTIFSGAVVSGISVGLTSAIGQGAMVAPIVALFTVTGLATIAVALRYFVVHFGVPETEEHGVGTLQ